MSAKKLAVVIPIYNEAENIKEMFERLKKVEETINKTMLVIFVDNKSKDNSLEILKSLLHDENVFVLKMSRNFLSPQPSIFAGLKFAHTQNVDACVVIDGDLQDPPELIEQFVAEWQKGIKIVYGYRKTRDESLVRKIGYFFFYRIFKYLSFLDIPMDAGDFCLLDKQVLEHMTAFSEVDIFVRGIRAWVGFSQIGVAYDRPIRKKGITSFSFMGYLRVAKDAIFSFSDKPLEYVFYLALSAAGITSIASLFYFYFAFTQQGAPKGFFTIIMMILFFGTLQLIALGIMAEYLIRIFREVKKRPPYIIEEVLNKKKPKP